MDWPNCANMSLLDMTDQQPKGAKKRQCVWGVENESE